MTVLVLMGVSGSGKTAVGEALADRLGWPFMEGDSLHPQANVDKMASGEPLTDEDRWPWLELVADWAGERIDNGQDGVITCSALKRSYREAISRGHDDVVFVYLAGERRTLEQRLGARTGHFMPVRLLDSQLDTLEDPAPDERSVRVALEQTVEQIVDEIVARLELER